MFTSFLNWVKRKSGFHTIYSSPLKYTDCQPTRNRKASEAIITLVCSVNLLNIAIHKKRQTCHHFLNFVLVAGKINSKEASKVQEKSRTCNSSHLFEKEGNVSSIPSLVVKHNKHVRNAFQHNS